MKFLNVYCEDRKKEVYIHLDKIVLLTKLEESSCQIELEGNSGSPIKVGMPVEDLIRKINGENRAGIGFRTSI